MNNNQIDLSAIYGLNNDCKSQEKYNAKNFLPAENIPSLEQIAAYNLASRGIKIPTSGNFDGDIGSEYNNAISQTSDYNGTSFDSSVDLTDNISDFPTGAYDDTINEINTERMTNIESAENTIESAKNTTITDFSNPFPVTADTIQYLNGFIRTQIGRRVKVEFLVGSNTLETREGYLLGVGANYILINELDTNDLTACDFYNVKFIRFFY